MQPWIYENGLINVLKNNLFMKFLQSVLTVSDREWRLGLIKLLITDTVRNDQMNLLSS